MKNLLGCNRNDLQTLVASLGEKAYRAQQLMQWIYQKQCTSLDQASNLPVRFMQALQDAGWDILLPEVEHVQQDPDGTRKWVLRSDEDNAIEMVLIPENNRNTLCISSQIGCPVDCSFCATGKMGFNRNLTTAEIVGQVVLAAQSIAAQPMVNNAPISNVVFMGMGEPLLNYANVMTAVDVFTDDFAYGLSKRRVTVSTSGVVPQILKMIGRVDVALALSLHAPNDALRSELVPLNNKHPIAEVLAACHQYVGAQSHKMSVTIEYALLAGINDSDALAHQLGVLLAQYPCKVNLIPFNPHPYADYQKPSNNRLHRFQQIVRGYGIVTTIRTTRGDSIDAACGQLVGTVRDRTQRYKRYNNKVSHATIIETVQ